MKTFHTFKNVDSFTKYLHEKHGQCEVAGKYGGCLDYVTVGGIVYTMHEYDMAGRSITWANKKHNKMLEMTTHDRYKDGYSDAEVTEYEPWGLRDDIAYAQ